jgi:ribonuclease G
MPGKYLVLMPNMDHIGISSKIEQRSERTRLRELMDKLLPEEMGVIVRTDAENKSETDLQRDLQFLISSWEVINNKYKTANVGDFLHMDLPLVVRTIREHIDNEPVTIICDHPNDLEEMQTFLKKFMPDNNVTLKLESRENIFKEFNIDKQIEQLLHKKVHLKSGGNIVIEHTEAMTVVDVNTAKFVGKGDQEETTLRTNMEAAVEVVRQLRLRNIGGIIIIDFIDMHKHNNKQALMALLQDELKTKDKLKSMTLNLSELGLIQMTRKRAGKNLSQEFLNNCNSCSGTGLIKSDGTIGCEVLRYIKDQILISNLQGKKIELKVASSIFEYLSKEEYKSILGLEKIYGVKILLAKEAKLERHEHKISLAK